MFKRFDFHIDPGHGWLEVTLQDALEVGLTTSSFSEYSYILPNNLTKSASLFLEEDQDMAIFSRAFERRHG